MLSKKLFVFISAIQTFQAFCPSHLPRPWETETRETTSPKDSPALSPTKICFFEGAHDKISWIIDYLKAMSRAIQEYRNTPSYNPIKFPIDQCDWVYRLCTDFIKNRLIINPLFLTVLKDVHINGVDGTADCYIEDICANFINFAPDKFLTLSPKEIVVFLDYLLPLQKAIEFIKEELNADLLFAQSEEANILSKYSEFLSIKAATPPPTTNP